MIFDIGIPEFMVLAMLALIVFGPDRLPGMAAQAARALKSLKAKASAATAELSTVVDTKALTDMAGDIAKLNPRGMVTSAVLGTTQVSPSVASVAPARSMNVRAEFDPDAT
jgi:sec-independent protein translocase protein TatB